MTLVLDHPKQELRYYHNKKFVGKFTGVTGKLYFTVSLRECNSVTLVPCVASSVLPTLIEEPEES
jgi:hypothetical protein